MPRLFLYSAHDKLILPKLVEEYVERTEQRLGSLCVKVEAVCGAGHMMIPVYDPELFAMSIHRFVSSHTRAGGEGLPHNWKQLKDAFIENLQLGSRRNNG